MKRSPGGDVLTDLVVKVFALNGVLVEIADEITEQTPLTAARWQILGAVLRTPLTVSDVARNMGLARQSVQRVADLLVDRGLCAYQDNPAHRRAKLLAPTAEGLAVIDRLRPIQAEWATRVAEQIGLETLAAARACVEALVELLATPAGRPRTAVRRRAAAPAQAVGSGA